MDKIFLSPNITKFFKFKSASVDCAVFKLHYKLTTVALLAASIMVTGYEYFGGRIHCITPKGVTNDGKGQKFIESFCWIEGTYSLPKAYEKEVGVEVVYPGVDNSKRGDDAVEHSYYQWVCMVLFLQALMFFLPHVIWKSFEGGKIKQLLMELDKPVEAQEVRETKFARISEYFYMQGTGHKLYFAKYIFCEILNFVNVIGQIYLVDVFLHGEFSKYGSEVINFMNQEQSDRIDPMIRVFPRVTKCSFYNYGPSGDVQAHDVFCILPLNILNEKIYVFVWLWFVILSVLTSFSLASKLLMAFWSQARRFAITSVCQMVEKKKLDKVLKKCSVGDWWVLFLLAKSMDRVNFKDLIDGMAKWAGGNDL